ncbi:MAG: hypothetical protein P8M22_03660 [Phycisphaerales bacterium]|nr:hypothetical protein [Phycisphaerales bacterium]
MIVLLLGPMILCRLALGLDVVELRGDLGELQGTVLASDEATLRIENSEGIRQEVAWDLVRDIRFDDPDGQNKAMADRLARANDIWRARSRLQRGDVDLAEPLFEKYFVPTPSNRDETSLIIAEGLLRCRLSRGDLVDAILPALETMRLRRLGVETDRYEQLGLLHDPGSGLCIYLPPAWAHETARSRLLSQLEQWDAGGDETLADVADTYRVLVEYPSGTIPESLLEKESDPVQRAGQEHPAFRLLELAVESRRDSVETRRSARAKMRSLLKQPSDWKRPWLHYLLGVSLLQESGDGMRRKGLVELAWIPSRYGSEHPYLAGIAMAMMAAELDRQGETEPAAKLRYELGTHYENHPAFRPRVADTVQKSQEELMR